MTTVREMIEMLQDFDPDSEIRIAFQPSWPFEYSVETAVDTRAPAHCPECGVHLSNDPPTGDCEACADSDFDTSDDSLPVAYIVPGNQIGYLPQAAADAMGW